MTVKLLSWRSFLVVFLHSDVRVRSSDVRKDGDFWWLQPDSKVKLTIEYALHSMASRLGYEFIGGLPPDGKTQVTFEYLVRR